MRRFAIVMLMLGCNGAELERTKQELIDSKARETALRGQVQQLQAELKDAKQSLALDDIAAAKCAEPEMARRMREHVEQNIFGFTANMGLKAEEILDDRGHLKDPVAFSKLLREWTIKHRGERNALPVLITTFGSEVGAAIWYGRISDDK